MDLMAEHRLEPRARIMAAVPELLAARGWRDVTIRDLAHDCRVSVPTLYNQFGGKDELIAAAALGHLSELLERTAGESGAAGACVSASVLWMRGGVGDSGLRAAMLHAAALLLLAGARGEARRALVRAARSAQAEFAGARRRSARRPGRAAAHTAR